MLWKWGSQLLANQRTVSRSRDHQGPIRGQYPAIGLHTPPQWRIYLWPTWKVVCRTVKEVVNWKFRQQFRDSWHLQQYILTGNQFLNIYWGPCTLMHNFKISLVYYNVIWTNVDSSIDSFSPCRYLSSQWSINLTNNWITIFDEEIEPLGARLEGQESTTSFRLQYWNCSTVILARQFLMQ